MVLLMGVVDVLAAVMLFDAGFGDLGFYISLALILKGATSIISSSLFHAMFSMGKV